MSRVLGIDPGTVRVGLAISDPDRVVATPLETVAGGEPAAVAEHVAAIANDHGCGTVVVGLPLAMSGRDTDSTRAARVLAKALADHGVDVRLWDERLTTVTADRALVSAAGGGRRRIQRRRDERDRLAATVLLQAWLDATRTADR